MDRFGFSADTSVCERLDKLLTQFQQFNIYFFSSQFGWMSSDALTVFGSFLGPWISSLHLNLNPFLCCSEIASVSEPETPLANSSMLPLRNTISVQSVWKWEKLRVGNDINQNGIFYSSVDRRARIVHRCYADVTPMLRRCYADVTPMLRRCYADVTPVLRRCYAGVTPVLRRCYAGVTPVLGRLLPALIMLLPHLSLF